MKLLQTKYNLLNLQETFLVDELSNGANPKSRHCVVCALALMVKRRKEKKKKKINNFQNLRSIIIYRHARGRASFCG